MTFSSAVLSQCGRFRYRLARRWAEGDHALFIMLNPSTADAEQDDPTIRKVCEFAKRWGYGGIEVVNLFALRAPKPEKLTQVADPIGPECDQHIENALNHPGCGYIVCAWGVNGSLYGRGSKVSLLIQEYDRQAFAFRIGKTGNPDHPLYQPYTREMVRFV